MRLVELVFAKFAALYGAKFADQWAGVDLASVHSTWADVLDTLTREEIAAGIRALVESGKPFPPTLPEFYVACRPRVEIPPASAHAELDAMARRLGLRTGGINSYAELRGRIVEAVRQDVPAAARLPHHTKQ